MIVPIEQIQVKRDINPRIGLDSDYIVELAGTDNLPPVTVTKDMVLVDGFHRLEAAKRRGDEKIRVTVQDVTEDEAMALAAKLNISHGKRLTVLELAGRVKFMVHKKGWTQEKTAAYFQKTRVWITHYMNIANKLDTTLVTRVTSLDYSSARELAKLPQNRQGEAYRMARKMASHDRKPSPTSRLVAKAVKKIQEENPVGGDKVLDFDRRKRWLMLSTLWNINVSDTRFGFSFPGRIPGQVVLNILYYYTKRNDLVVDPFGGSGTTLDACNHLGRRCLIYDIEPARKEIAKHDISDGFPTAAQDCDLILLDPPYWRQKRGKYPKGKDSFSEVDLDGFNRKMEMLIRDCYKTVKTGGHVALLIQNTTELGEEMEKAGRYYADHIFDCHGFFTKAGFTPVQRINVPLSWEQFAGFDIDKAKKEKRLLGVVRDLLIMRKEQD